MEEIYPDELRYHTEHDWVRIEGEEAIFGVTWYAQDALGEVVFYEPPTVGQTIATGGTYGVLESIKAVSDLIAPASGTIVAVNDGVAANPDLVNSDPYGAGWLVRVRLSSPDEIAGLMDAETYREYLAGL